MLELPKDQPHQPSKQSHAEDHTNRLKPEAEKIIAEEQAGFRTERIFNLGILCEKHLQHSTMFS